MEATDWGEGWFHGKRKSFWKNGWKGLAM